VARSKQEDLMTRVGITGHQRLGGSDKRKQIKRALESVVRDFSGSLIAVSSLAVGADQLFARVMMDHGAAIDAVIPFQGYERTFTTAGTRNKYFALLAEAASVTVLPRVGNDEECFLNAGKTVVRRSDVLIAIWDGKPARGLGGTADIVRFAKDEQRIEIKWINPDASASLRTISALTSP
jgi:hypothetical protein